MKLLWLPQIVFNSDGGGSGGGDSGGGDSSPAPSTSQTTVQSGQTLSQIAAANNTSVAAIAAANPSIKNVNKINVGQKLTIPKNTGESTYAGGIGASGSGAVTRDDSGGIRVATGSKTSTTLKPVATGGIEPVETSTPTFSSYKPGQAVNQATGKATTTTNAAGQTVKVAASAPKNMKPNILGYGYYDPNTGAWIPPEIDMKNGGGPGMAGAVFASGGGQEADTNKDGYLSLEEAKAGKESGVLKSGLGAVSNAIGATPFGSNQAPTGIAAVAANSMLGRLAGYDPEQQQQRFGAGIGMTQEQVNAYMGGTPEEVAARRAEQSRQAQAELSRSDDNQPAAPESTEVVPDVQCPEGYMFDSEKNACVVDPFAQPFPDAPAVSTPAVPVSATLSPYTAALPTNLSALNPSYVAGQGTVAQASPIALSAIQPQIRTMPAGNIQQGVPGYPPGFTPRPNPLVGGPGLAGLMVPPIASV